MSSITAEKPRISRKPQVKLKYKVSGGNAMTIDVIGFAAASKAMRMMLSFTPSVTLSKVI